MGIARPCCDGLHRGRVVGGADDMKNIPWIYVLILAIVLLLTPYSLWMHFAGDCHSWWFRFMEAGDLPGRCVVR